MIRRLLCRLGWHAWEQSHWGPHRLAVWQCIDCHRTKALTFGELQETRGAR